MKKEILPTINSCKSC